MNQRRSLVCHKTRSVAINKVAITQKLDIACILYHLLILCLLIIDHNLKFYLYKWGSQKQMYNIANAHTNKHKINAHDTNVHFYCILQYYLNSRSNVTDLI